MAEHKYVVGLTVAPPDTFAVTSVEEIAFPKLMLLDSFKRTNENPLSNGGKWAKYHYPHAGQVLEEAFTSEAGNNGGSYWTPQEFEEPAVAVELHALPISEQLRLFSCLQNPTSNINGYLLLFVSESSTVGSFVLEGIVNGKSSFETKAVTTNVEAGDSIGLSVQAQKVFAWHKSSIGPWEIVAENPDSHYVKGYVGLEAESNLVRVRNFEVGES